jgi:hypothetical protein
VTDRSRRRLKLNMRGRPAPTRSNDFVMLRYQGKVPAMASCAKCKRKFFTPTTYSRDPVGAKEYLLSKFDRHHCDEKAKERARRGDWI